MASHAFSSSFLAASSSPLARSSISSRPLACALIAAASLTAVACGGASESPQDENGGANAPPANGDARGRFIVVGAGGVELSDDGRSWRAGADLGAAPVAVGHAGTTAVVIDAEGRAHVSRDAGDSWLAATDALQPEKSSSLTVTHDGQRFVAVGGGWSKGAISAVSPDGLAWTALPAPESQMFRSAFQTPGGVRAAAAFRSDLMTPSLYALEQGGWRKLDPAPFLDGERDGIAGTVHVPERASTFAIVGSRVWDTKDGNTWTAHEVAGAPARLRALTAGAGRLVAVGEAGAAASSTDGATWTSTTIGEASQGGFFQGIAYGAGVFVALGELRTGAVRAISADGQTWEVVARTDRLTPTEIVFAAR